MALRTPSLQGVQTPVLLGPVTRLGGSRELPPTTPTPFKCEHGRPGPATATFTRQVAAKSRRIDTQRLPPGAVFVVEVVKVGAKSVLAGPTDPGPIELRFTGLAWGIEPPEDR
jgi:hypothetical protein